ncbi:hypothetical protein MKZ38_002420 [Zalerion maritima]|uniref:PX domain-containing protein n=1 Tax=Zalerion maritima TaxID=339359 RepID=A0AAD5RNY1_9PEZI|nr:hypothetical protein MKZ38_002420 [Zalerion maritima]
MIVTSPQLPIIQTKPQVHSRKLHHTYNACKVLPVSASVRAASLSSPATTPTTSPCCRQQKPPATTTFLFGNDDFSATLMLDIGGDASGHPGHPAITAEENDTLYEIVLYYSHNRACTIYRTWEDFTLLYRNLPRWRGAPRLVEDAGPNDVLALHLFLQAAIVKRPRAVGLEFFLRRRMGDCCAR